MGVDSVADDALDLQGEGEGWVRGVRGEGRLEK